MIDKIKADSSGFVWFHRTFDAIIPVIVLYMINIYANETWHDRYLVMGLLGGLLFVVIAQQLGIYENWRGRPFFASVKLTIQSWLITWGLLIVIAFIYKDTENFSRLSVLLFALTTPVSLISYRLVIRSILAKYRQIDKNTKSIVIIGAGKVGQHVATIITKNPWLGYRIAGFFDDNHKLKGKSVKGLPVISDTVNISEAVNENQYNEVYICLPMRSEAKIKQILNELTDTTATVKLVPDLFTFDLMHSKWSELKGLPVFSVFDTPLNSATSRFLKRLQDIVLSSIILILISPVMIVLSFGVKITSPGPILYRQKRIGWNGSEFNMLKFRSMPVNTEANGVEWGGAKSKTNTKFGSFIRRTSLDELPQFINVLLGDMSIVGPRPERDIFVEQFRKEIPRYMQKHMVKAGITGWAQVNGWRGDTSLEKRIEYDLHYINSWSLWLDFRIIFLTIIKGFTHNAS